MFVCRPDGTFLMQRQVSGCAIGTWSLPGGKVRKGESIREAAIREVREETGIRVQGNRIVAITEAPSCPCSKHKIIFWLKSEGTIPGEDPILNYGSSDFQWVKWGDWPQPLWQPYWDDLFKALNSSHKVGMAGGLRE